MPGERYEKTIGPGIQKDPDGGWIRYVRIEPGKAACIEASRSEPQATSYKRQATSNKLRQFVAFTSKEDKIINKQTTERKNAYESLLRYDIRVCT